MRKIGVVLLSGGLDSTTVATYAKGQGYELTSITLHYGQKHSKEIDSARLIAERLELKHEVIDISFFKTLAWYSALTSPDLFDVPVDRDSEEMARYIPITYVPLRNTFFITIAAAFLESEALALIEKDHVDPAQLDASIFIAANAIDYSGYPDCRPEFYETMGATLTKGSKLGTQYDTSMSIETPIIQMTKAEIIRFGMELGAPIEDTWSCYEGGTRPCGECDSCVLRAKGFEEAEVNDPALELKK